MRTRRRLLFFPRGVHTPQHTHQPTGAAGRLVLLLLLLPLLPLRGVDVAASPLRVPKERQALPASSTGKPKERQALPASTGKPLFQQSPASTGWLEPAGRQPLLLLSRRRPLAVRTRGRDAPIRGHKHVLGNDVGRLCRAVT